MPFVDPGGSWRGASQAHLLVVAVVGADGLALGVVGVAVVGVVACSLGVPVPKEDLGLVLGALFVQSLKMLPAMNAHIPSGYAEEGEVLKPPPAASPIMGSLCR